MTNLIQRVRTRLATPGAAKPANRQATAASAPNLPDLTPDQAIAELKRLTREAEARQAKATRRTGVKAAASWDKAIAAVNAERAAVIVDRARR